MAAYTAISGGLVDSWHRCSGSHRDSDASTSWGHISAPSRPMVLVLGFPSFRCSLAFRSRYWLLSSSSMVGYIGDTAQFHQIFFCKKIHQGHLKRRYWTDRRDPHSAARVPTAGASKLGRSFLEESSFAAADHSPPSSSLAMLSLDTVRRTARDEGYREIFYNENSRVISFQRGDVRINVYYTTGTVGTCIDHPRQGKTQLFRRDVDSSLLRTLFNNPRTHTDRGYQRQQRSRSRSRSRSP